MLLTQSPSPLRDFWHCAAKKHWSTENWITRDPRARNIEHGWVAPAPASIIMPSYEVIFKTSWSFWTSCMFYEMIYYPSENIIIFDLTFIPPSSLCYHHRQIRRRLTHYDDANHFFRPDTIFQFCDLNYLDDERWFHTRSWLVGFCFSRSLSLDNDEWMDYMCFRVVFVPWSQISGNLILKIALFGRSYISHHFCGDLSPGGQCTNLIRQK